MMNMYNNLANMVVGFSLFLGCKVTTNIRKLYQFPMEKMQRKEKRKLLQINGLWASAHFALWKMSGEGMERHTKGVGQLSHPLDFVV